MKKFGALLVIVLLILVIYYSGVLQNSAVVSWITEAIRTMVGWLEQGAKMLSDFVQRTTTD